MHLIAGLLQALWKQPFNEGRFAQRFTVWCGSALGDKHVDREELRRSSLGRRSTHHLSHGRTKPLLHEALKVHTGLPDVVDVETLLPLPAIDALLTGDTRFDAEFGREVVRVLALANERLL